MDKLVEFGYHVSKDYEKLWGLIHSGKRMFGLVNYKGNSGNVMRDVVGIEYLDKYDSYIIGSRGISHVGVIDTKNDFIENCKEINLTFIDPEPASQNAIYYEDGSVVEVGDKWKFITHEDKSIYTVKCKHGALYSENTNGYAKILFDFISVYWDGNRMTNVSKVVE